MSEYAGACHCGNIACRYTLPADRGPIPVRECGCTFCSKHGAIWTSDPSGSLALTLRDPERVVRHRFATATADFLICSICGTLTAAVCEIGGNRFAVLNVNILEEFDPLGSEPQTMNYDGESVAERLERRQARWIPDVTWNA